MPASGDGSAGLPSPRETDGDVGRPSGPSVSGPGSVHRTNSHGDPGGSRFDADAVHCTGLSTCRGHVPCLVLPACRPVGVRPAGAPAGDGFVTGALLAGPSRARGASVTSPDTVGFPGKPSFIATKRQPISQRPRYSPARVPQATGTEGAFTTPGRSRSGLSNRAMYDMMHSAWERPLSAGRWHGTEVAPTESGAPEASHRPQSSVGGASGDTSELTPRRSSRSMPSRCRRLAPGWQSQAGVCTQRSADTGRTAWTT